MLVLHLNGDNHIQNFHLRRYIVGNTFGNHVLLLRLRVALKLNFRLYIRRYTSPTENFEYSYPLNARPQFMQLTFQQDLEILQSQITTYLPMTTIHDARPQFKQLTFQQDLEVLQSQITTYLPMTTIHDARPQFMQLTF